MIVIVVVVRSGSGGGGLHRRNCRCGKLLCVAVVVEINIMTLLWESVDGYLIRGMGVDVSPCHFPE